MEEQDNVAQVEETTPESLPVEQTTEVAPQESADTIVEPEKEISKAVPYDRFHEVNSKAKQLEEENAYLKAMVGQQPAQVPGNDAPFDPDTQQALEQWYSSRREAEKSAEFARRHAEELKDPLLSGAVQRLIAEANSKGQYVDHEEALKTAQKMLDERIKPVLEQAKNQGIEEGQEVARKKEQAGAIGQPIKQEPIDESKLSAAELAKLHNIPRVN